METSQLSLHTLKTYYICFNPKIMLNLKIFLRKYINVIVLRILTEIYLKYVVATKSSLTNDERLFNNIHIALVQYFLTYCVLICVNFFYFNYLF